MTEALKKACVDCGKQIPQAAHDCVFCSARQPNEPERPNLDAGALHFSSTDHTMVNLKLSDLHAALQAAAAAELTEPESPKPELPKPELPKPESPKPEPPKPEPPKPEPPRPMEPSDDSSVDLALDTASFPLLTDSSESSDPSGRVVGDAIALEGTRPFARGTTDLGFIEVGRRAMLLAGVVLLLIFFLPWRGTSSWQLLGMLVGADFVRQYSYLSSGLVLTVAALLPLPFVFRSSMGLSAAMIPLSLGLHGLMQGWRALAGAVALVALIAVNILRTRGERAQLLWLSTVVTVALLYLVPVQGELPLSAILGRAGGGAVGMAGYLLLPLLFLALSSSSLRIGGIEGNFVIGGLCLFWPLPLMLAYGAHIDDSAQVYLAIAICAASTTAALSLAQVVVASSPPR